MHLIIVVIFLYAGFTFYALADDSQLLEKADTIKFSDRSQAQRLLDRISLAQLSEAQMNYYRFLKAYLSTFDGDLDYTLERYETLLDTLPESELRIRVLQAALGIASYREKWQRSFELASELELLLSKPVSKNVETEAFQGLLVFYKNVGLPETALIYINRILAHPDARPEHICFAKSKQIEVYLADNSVTETQINEAIKICRQTEQDYFVATNLIVKVDYYIGNSLLSKARVAAKKAWAAVEPVNFIFLKSQFLTTYAHLKFRLGHKKSAANLARQVIDLDKTEQYKASLIKAYKLLAQLAVAQHNYQQAYTYVSAVNRLEDDFHSEQVVKSLALQQARFNLKNKETHIALLDEKNKLLSEESRLVGEKAQSMVIALGLAMVMVFVTLYWAFRTRKMQKRLRYLATTDALTDVANRGYFSDQATMALIKAQHRGQPVALIFFDLDHFKKINDTHGHQTGDWVLREVVKVINQCCTPNHHLLGRIGGEEFGILMTNTDNNTALVFAERCRESIGRIEPPITGHELTISASFGVSDTQQVGYHLEHLFSASDLALYQAKKYGRNQVCVYSEKI
ncbi:GGDEF domain-containing protein [Salinimonas marina]|uniref:diguanylate cyclase n=1 Tax=Salinimonas marina TaxID=2785918 RepID=A0A7S9HEG8_9ALTE|nr:GGDEF domain-containing protein [Salinimonas marina]QPG06877.1 GGDEF domain-containing protein [Salinimonas marina]